MPFEFVDNATINRGARKRIRSHVAKGNNVGKTHPSRRKQRNVGIRITLPLCNRRAAGATHDTASEEEEVSEVERQIGDGLSVYSFPVELDSQSKGLVKTVFDFMNGSLDTPELHHAIDFAGAAGMWIQYIFLDQAYFHCTVAMCATAVNSLLLRDKDSLAAMRHMSDTFRLVNEKLSGEEALSDATMAVINGLTHYERIRGHHVQGLVHFEGLLRIAELRGGISCLKAALAQKIHRADLEFALYFGTATRFRVADLPGSATLLCLRSKFAPHQQDQSCDSETEKISPSLRDVLIDCMSLAWLLNDRSGRGAKLDGYTYHDIIILIGYRLVLISPFNSPRPSNTLENDLHLGCLAFLTTLLLGFGRKFPHFPLLAKHFSLAVRESLGRHEKHQEFYFWTLFIGAVATVENANDHCLMSRVSEISLALGLSSWEDINRTLSKFPWINSLHNNAGKALWNRSSFLYNTSTANIEIKISS